jgi:predicted TIM-barrel fold metal-dependent hydrolase
MASFTIGICETAPRRISVEPEETGRGDARDAAIARPAAGSARSEEQNVTVVDIHPHIVSEDTARYPITPLGGKRSDWSHARSVELQGLLDAMKEAGVDKAAVVHSSTTYGFNCEYVADAVAQYPDRLTGVFSVNVLEPDGPAEMRKWYDKGLTGMRIFSRGSTIKEPWLSLDDERIFPCYELAGDLGIAVASNIQVANFSQLDTVLRRFPDTNFIVDHLGGVDFSDGAPFDNARALFAMARHPNFHLKVTTQNFAKASNGQATPETLFARLVAEFGADRLAWGSNFPASPGSLAEQVRQARQGLATLRQADQDWIMGGTALKLYPALARQTVAA